jgi:hypothetical protein
MAEPPKSVQDFLQRPDEDESVRKWKESLLGDAAQDLSLASPKDDPRLVIAKEFKVVVTGGQTLTYNLENQDQLNDLKKNGYKLKEGQTFHYEITILVHHEIVLGLKLVTKSKKMLVKDEHAFEIGSYPPTVAPIVKELEECEVPAGMMARGEYHCTSTVEDDMGRTHFKFEMKFSIDKA